eukprot:7167567-Ditylum_brightwellii.AAC.1
MRPCPLQQFLHGVDRAKQGGSSPSTCSQWVMSGNGKIVWRHQSPPSSPQGYHLYWSVGVKFSTLREMLYCTKF